MGTVSPIAHDPTHTPDGVPIVWRANYGRYPTEKAALDAIVERLVTELAPLQVFLFGSRAEGRSTPDSDFDLFVVFGDHDPNADASHDDVYAPLRGLGIDCDVIPCLRSEVAEVLSDSCNPWQAAWRNARVLYERR